MTNQREAFEKWYDNGEPDALPKDYEILGKNYLWMGWKAAQQYGEGEPVAWMWDNNGVTEYTQDIHSVEYYSSIYGIEMTPLYLAPPDQTARIDELQKQNDVMLNILKELEANWVRLDWGYNSKLRPKVQEFLATVKRGVNMDIREQFESHYSSLIKEVQWTGTKYAPNYAHSDTYTAHVVNRMFESYQVANFAQQAEITRLKKQNEKLRDALEWALGCIDVTNWENTDGMQVAVNAYNKANEALSEDK